MEKELNNLGIVVTKLDLEKTDPRLGNRNTSLTQTRSSKFGTLTERDSNRVILSANYNTDGKEEDKEG